jgi:hypothetical protein
MSKTSYILFGIVGLILWLIVRKPKVVVAAQVPMQIPQSAPATSVQQIQGVVGAVSGAVTAATGTVNALSNVFGGLSSFDSGSLDMSSGETTDYGEF